MKYFQSLYQLAGFVLEFYKRMWRGERSILSLLSPEQATAMQWATVHRPTIEAIEKVVRDNALIFMRGDAATMTPFSAFVKEAFGRMVDGEGSFLSPTGVPAPREDPNSEFGLAEILENQAIDYDLRRTVGTMLVHPMFNELVDGTPIQVIAETVKQQVGGWSLNDATARFQREETLPYHVIKGDEIHA